MVIDYEKSNTYCAFITLEKGEDYPDTIKYFVKGENKNRIFKKCICDTCSKIYYRRKHRKGSKYCSNICRYPLIIVKCFNCGKERKINKYKFEHSKNNIFFCSRECKDFGQSIEGGITEIQPSHFGDGKYEYQSRAMRYQKRKFGYNFCEICDERDELYLIVHHRDCNRENSKIENLRVICANCHVKGHRTGRW